MIISQPDDGKGLLYHVVNLLGTTVHAYRDLNTSTQRREGDQRVFLQVERTGCWLTDEPHPLSEAAARPAASRVSAATLSYVDLLLRAAGKRQLALASSTLVETDQPVAIFVAVERDGTDYVLSPLAMLAGPPGAHIAVDGALTQAASDAFGMLRSQLRSKTFQPWFGLDEQGRGDVDDGEARQGAGCEATCPGHPSLE